MSSLRCSPFIGENAIPSKSITSSPAFANNQGVTWLLPEDGRHARINQWSFNIQRELRGSLLLDVGYVGSYTDHLNSRIPFNQVDPKYLAQANLLGLPISDPAVVAAGFRKPYPSFPDAGRLAGKPLSH